MRKFIHEDFLLDTPQACELFHGVAEKLPIIDYHCHLDPAKIANDMRFENITQAWLAGDHYKWRGMRSVGVDETFCTGNASDRDKFNMWAASVPKFLRNPLYHWTHLELRRPFGIDDCLLSSETADKIWTETNLKLASPGFGAYGILRQMNVELVCTTDDPTDSLEHHIHFAAQADRGLRLFPTWRPDKARNILNPQLFNQWVDKLETVSGMSVRTLEVFLDALQKRHAFFHAAGCRLSDHSLERLGGHFPSMMEVSLIFEKVRHHDVPTAEEADIFNLFMLFQFSSWDAQAGWTQQYHIGAMRNPNRKAFTALGPDTGFDAVADFAFAVPFAEHLSRIAEADQLPKTIVYNLNPRDNEMLAVLCGSFQFGAAAGKIQFGAAWWFLDQMDGISRHIETLSQLGVLSQFVGMLTDSRSFLSFTRHEYFRRILCRILGREMKDGLIPDDPLLIGRMVRAISHDNAASFFNFQK